MSSIGRSVVAHIDESERVAARCRVQTPRQRRRAQKRVNRTRGRRQS